MPLEIIALIDRQLGPTTGPCDYPNQKRNRIDNLPRRRGPKETAANTCNRAFLEPEGAVIIHEHDDLVRTVVAQHIDGRDHLLLLVLLVLDLFVISFEPMP